MSRCYRPVVTQVELLMSAEHYDWLVAAARRTHFTAAAVPAVAEAVRRAEMDPEHAGLDELLK